MDQNNITEAWWYMSKRVTMAITTIAIFLSSIFPVMAGQEIVPADVTVKVQYQLKMDGYNSWTTTNASLRGAPVCLLWQDCCPYCPLPDEAGKVCLDEWNRYVEQRPD